MHQEAIVPIGRTFALPGTSQKKVAGVKDAPARLQQAVRLV